MFTKHFYNANTQLSSVYGEVTRKMTDESKPGKPNATLIPHLRNV